MDIYSRFGERMKRSEFIEKLGHQLHLINLHYIESRELDDLTVRDANLLIAGKILDFLENAGMSPPFDHDLHFYTWRNGGNGLAWEPEDDA